MSEEHIGLQPNEWLEFVALAGEIRPALHRYCARLMGSVIEGEDIVQDTLMRAFTSLRDLPEMPVLRPWLFRIAHNRSVDVLRARQLRMTEPLEDLIDDADLLHVDPLETIIDHESLRISLSHFLDLPIAQRSVVILKDVLGESLADIAALLNFSIDSVKGHLARGRARLALHAVDTQPSKKPSPQLAHYVELFNQRNWDGLRALLSDDVQLKQSSHPLRVGKTDVGMFFTIYAKSHVVHLEPVWLENREVIAVFPDADAAMPSHIMWLEWSGDRISFIHDYRYVDYLLEDANLLTY